jgi:hypothetical protein
MRRSTLLSLPPSLKVPCLLKNYVIQVEGWLGKNDITQGQATSATGMSPGQKVNNAEERTYISTN